MLKIGRIVLNTSFILLLLKASDLIGQDKPNIIFFIADDADKYQFGCFGGPVHTPHIDRLAAQGAIFHQAYVNSTVCTPSRYSLTTGRYAGRSGSENYLMKYPKGSQGHPEFNVGLEQDYLNVGKILQDAGYITGWIGKYHMNADNTLAGGFTTEEKIYLKDASQDDPLATQIFSRVEKAYRDYIMNLGFSWAKNIYEGNLMNPFNEHNLEWTIEAALEFIENAGEQPFYLHFNTTLLHGPDNSWERSLDYPEVTGEGIVKRSLNADMPPRNTILERISDAGFSMRENPAGITWLDDGVGAIMRKLEELGIAKNTMVVFMPDHGSANKASLYNLHGANVPLIIYYPREITPLTTSNSMVQGLDLIPTFYELAGAEVPSEYMLDGVSIRPLFSDPGKKMHESLYFELGCARGVLTEEFKYIAVRYTQDRTNEILQIKEKDLNSQILRKMIYLDGHIGISLRGIRYNPEYLSPDQLYKITGDPEETINLANDPDYQEVLREMKDLLTGYLTDFEDRPFGEFVPGPNATPPDPVVTNRINDIKQVLKEGATIDRDGQIILNQ